MVRHFRQFGTLLAALAVFPTWAAAQQGRITGRVTDATTQTPVPSAQVVVVGTTRGAISRADGSYTIDGVKPGQVRVRAQRIGYASSTDTATVTGGGSATVNFALKQTAVQIDQVVVTATGQTERRRESGASIGFVNVDSTIKQAAVQNFSNVLSARIPGVTVQSSGGTAGTGARIRIRGSNSVSLSNDPLLIVDGIRVDNDANATTIGVGGQTPSRFDDIDPDNIASIEVLKGPAATALYGTSASNGVIRVTTKRGRPGTTRWSAHAEYGTVNEETQFPANFTQIGTTLDTTLTGVVGDATQCLTIDIAAGHCSAANLRSFNPIEVHSPFIQGWQEQYGVSAAGGGQNTTYYLSGNFNRNQGIYDPNKVRKVDLRANLHSQLADNFDVTVTTGYLQSRVAFPQNDNNTDGIISEGLLGQSVDDSVKFGYLSTKPENLFQLDTKQDLERFTGGITANWEPLSWLSANGIAGIDYSSRYDQFFIAPGVIPTSLSLNENQGQRQSNPNSIWDYTANGNVTATFGLTPALTSATSGGVQYERQLLHGTQAFGQDIVAGTSSLNGATSLFAVGENTQDVITIGGYVQERLSWRDRVIGNVGLRADRNSAFGVNFGYVYYPNASLSWVIGEEPWFPQNKWVSSLRLRSAFGVSGQKPNFRDAITFYQPVAVAAQTGEVGGITIGGTGNTDLKPEKSSEYEMGFDAGFLNDRATLQMTYYNKTTRDALVARPLPPSLGGSQSQFVNLGKVKNDGLEGILHADVVNTQPVGFDITFNGSILHNKLIDLGEVNGTPIPPIIFGLGANTQRHTNGYPLGGYWQKPILGFADKNGDGIIGADEVTVGDTATFLGSPFPKYELSITPRVTLFKYVELSGLFDYRGGYKLYNGTEDFRCRVFANCRALNDPTAPLAEQARAVADFVDGTQAGYIEDAAFWKLRELSVTLTAPNSWSKRAGLSGLSLTLAGRNLHTWTNYTGFDPEVNEAGQANFTTADFLTQPPVRYYTARINVNW
ncbi:MAG TPA: SusC/RagA family TonB-linked outer membrane protein [Gemmatimonadaceae bacterium]|nr:SusC/RagA family TonB-linked outer membrane protein [Gemmatimonadaceae bacterium]